MAEIAGELYGERYARIPSSRRSSRKPHSWAACSATSIKCWEEWVGPASLASQLRQPTLIMHGDDDPLVPLVNAKIMHSLIPHSKLYIFHDGHLGLGTSAQELAQVVDQFLTAPVSSSTGGA